MADYTRRRAALWRTNRPRGARRDLTALSFAARQAHLANPHAFAESDRGTRGVGGKGGIAAGAL